MTAILSVSVLILCVKTFVQEENVGSIFPRQKKDLSPSIELALIN